MILGTRFFLVTAVVSTSLINPIVYCKCQVTVHCMYTVNQSFPGHWSLINPIVGTVQYICVLYSGSKLFWSLHPEVSTSLINPV